ncbi:hypothetical protein GF337_16785 [candidate division KSB1 bacterium]|nr:hypothetical protein [candidate division KSB1 bacterium]
MKKCKRFKRLISDYIEGALNVTDKTSFESHLQDCVNCADTVSRVTKLSTRMKKLKHIKTSEDFNTVLHTRIRIESGIGRRRLHEIVWSWPAKVPVYGMALAIIVIAVVLVLEQIDNPYQSPAPAPYINAEWYGGNPDQQTSSDILTETENVIYVIERTSPEKLIQSQGQSLNSSYLDSINRTQDSDSLTLRNSQSYQVNQIVY